VWLVELASRADRRLVPDAVASALGVSEQPGRERLESITDSLRSKQLLLILDNCEHVVAACAEVAETVLQRCPGVRVLATSRERLATMGEMTYSIPPLSLPALDPLPPPNELVQYDAVRLFVNRAAVSKPSFQLTIATAPPVVEACHRLDGIPLAIELAAARVRVLSVGEITSRLSDRFQLLTRGARALLPRHQTLRAAMDWSYLLLSEVEQVVLRRLSIFAGGWTLEAAEAVCSGEGVGQPEVINVLGQLVDKSLVVAEEEPREGRFRLLETVRQYAWGRLREAREETDLRKRHLTWCLELAEHAEPQLEGPSQREWLERLEVEHDNLRAALEWTTTSASDAEAGLRLAGALGHFWFMHGHWSEGRRRLDEALRHCSTPPVPSFVKILQRSAYLAWRQGEYAKAVALSEQGLALCRQQGDRKGIATFLLNLATVATLRGEFARSAPLGEESLLIGRELGDNVLTSWALGLMGTCARLQGDHRRAETLFTESLAFGRKAGHLYHVAYVLRNLGLVALLQGDHERASAFFKESIVVAQGVGDKWVTQMCLAGLASVAGASGQHDRAARLFGAAEALREQLSYHRPPASQAEQQLFMADARGAIGDRAFAMAWELGRKMTIAQAVESALAPAAAVAASNDGASTVLPEQRIGRLSSRAWSRRSSRKA
jgi:non-specific serine/threonine protein kinase